MSENGKQLDVIPFGKYKGKPVDVLQSDRNYCDWILGNSDVRAKYPHVVNMIINNFGEPDETPEHNGIQAKFLDRDFTRQFWSLAYPGYPLHTVYHAEFEKKGIDVLLRMDCWIPCFKNERDEWLEGFDVNGGESKWEYGSRTLAVEIKPVLSDNYPAVLRQILGLPLVFQRNGYVMWKYEPILCIEQYNGIGATLEQVRQMFSNSGVKLVFVSEIESAKPAQVTTERP